MIQEQDRVIVPSYRSWDENDQPYMVSDEANLIGTVDKLMALSTGPDGEPMPGSDFHAWVVLDNPIGIQDVIQCKASRLTKIED